jgi:phage major head subunit gpT-like protein
VGGVKAWAGSECLDKLEASGRAASEETFEGSVATASEGIEASMLMAEMIE